MFNIFNYTGTNATNLMAAFNEFSTDEASKFPNMWPKSESPNKLNSAVLGMLSLSQSHQFPVQYSSYNPVGLTQQSNFHVDSSNGDETRHCSTILPSTLTPPGSPNESKGLVIASPEKTPCKTNIVNDCQQHCAVQQPTHHSSPNHGMSMISDTMVNNLNDYSSASGSQHYQLASFLNGNECFDASTVSMVLNAASGHHSQSMTNKQRSRSEKKPIPVESKDDRYFERRRRNNVAAKKSRDVRKYREDEIATRAAYLEKENAILRAQMATLREEATSLRHLLLQKRQRQMQMHLQQPSTMALG